MYHGYEPTEFRNASEKRSVALRFVQLATDVVEGVREEERT
jgi:hypothetical protein